MIITHSPGTFITLEEATDMTHAYQKAYPDEIKSYFAAGNAVRTILDQEGCTGIRIYNALDKAAGKKRLVVLGVDGSGRDMTEGMILDYLLTCPPVCPDSIMNISE